MAEGFMGGLMEGFLSQVAPGYFNAMKQEEYASSKEKAKQQQLQNLANMSDPYYQGLIDAEKDPRRVALLNSRKLLAKSQNALFAEMWPELIKQDSQELYDAAQPSETIKNIDYLSQLDPSHYSAPIRAKILEQHMVKPQTQISMGQTRPAPSSGYMYATENPNDPTQTYVPGGPQDPNTKPLTESEGKNTSFYTTSKAAADILDKLYPTTNIAALRAHGVASDIPVVGKALGIATSGMLDPQSQQVSQAEAQFLDSINRFRSGANLTEYDITSANKMFFEQPKESKESKAQKAAMRKLAWESLEAPAGLTRRRDDTPKVKSQALPSNANVVEIDMSAGPAEIKALEAIAKKSGVKPIYVNEKPKIIGGKKFHMINGKLMVED